MKNKDKPSKQEYQHQYEIEKKLAIKLKKANPTQRKRLYGQVYDELLRKVPSHSCLNQNQDRIAKYVLEQLRLLRRYVNKSLTFLEIGAGDCGLSKEISKLTHKVYVAEVSKIITKNQQLPENLKLIRPDGTRLKIKNNEVDLAYSKDFIEHLHPEDAKGHLKEMRRTMKPGGSYICITPNRLSGPHDISRLFDEQAKGLHLKEYTNTELYALFKSAGFSKVRILFGGKGLYLQVPHLIISSLEKALEKTPYKLRIAITRYTPVRIMLNNAIIATK
jgi:SAM-dependent methyltransferase